MLLVWLSALAQAGSGPWVPGTGRTSLYLGVDGQRFGVVRASGGDGDPQDVPIAEGVGSFSGVAVLAYGLGSRAEIEVGVPLQHSWVTRPDSAFCEQLGLDGCKAATTPGIVEFRVKGLLADQVAGAPFSFALGGLVRYGGLTAGTRERLTNAGEGTLDLGGSAAIGHGAALPRGYYSAHLDVAWFYRTPNTATYPRFEGDESVPGSEGQALADVLYAPVDSVSFGPSASFSARPGGRDFLDLDFTDPDRFSALRYAQLRVGGKLVLRGGEGHSFVVSVHRTAWAWNNPKDVLSVAAGVSLADLFRRKLGG
jgi:hypothetical protein